MWALIERCYLRRVFRALPYTWAMQRAWLPVIVTVAIAVLADLKVSTTNTDVITDVAQSSGVVSTFLGPPKALAEGGTSAALDPAIKAALELPRLHSLLVSQRGTIILERYFNGRRETTPANVKSVSKSVISALVGIAIGPEAALARPADREILSGPHGARSEPSPSRIC